MTKPMRSRKHMALIMDELNKPLSKEEKQFLDRCQKELEAQKA